MKNQALIKEATIYAPRFGGTDQELKFEVANLISELNIYEDLRLPYLTGKILIVDKGGLFQNIMFTGSEHIDIVIQNDAFEGAPSITKTFILKKLENTNDERSVFLFDMIEPHGFLGQIKTLNKSFKGKIEDIISKIIKNNFNKEIDLSDDGTNWYAEESVQKNIKAIIPSWNVVKTIKWFADRLSTSIGAPFYVYTKLQSEKIKLGSLDYLIEQNPFNVTPFYYTPTYAGSTEGVSETAKMFSISKVSLANNKCEYELAKAGAHGMNYDLTDMSATTNTSFHVSGAKYIEALNESLFNKNYSQNLFDLNFKLNETFVEDYDTVTQESVTNSKTYLDYNNYSHEDDKGRMKSKVNSNMLKSMLSSNLITVESPGAGFLSSGAGVGEVMRVYFNRLDFSDVQSNNVFEKDISGDFLITNIKHRFAQQQHTVEAMITKINRKNNINAEG